MEQQLSIVLQVALFVASGAVVAIAAVAIHAWLSVRKQLDRVVAAVEHVEAEIIPLARETRVVVDSLRGLSEQTASVAGGLLLPFRTVNTALSLMQTGVTAFLQALWTGRRPQPNDRHAAHKESLS